METLSATRGSPLILLVCRHACLPGPSGEAEHEETVQALQETQEHIVGKLHTEMQSLRTEMAELRTLLEQRDRVRTY